jgi:protein-tyrosine phosphatase
VGVVVNNIRQTDAMTPHPSWPYDEMIHAWWVQPDRLLAGEYPGDREETQARGKIRCLLDAGIDSFVDLTESGVMEPYEHLLDDEAEKTKRPVPNYRRFAIPDVGIVSDEDYAKILAHIRHELDAGKGVYVHCWGGKGRTGTVIGCWLIDNDALDYQAAMRRLQDLRAGTRKAHEHVPESSAQRDVLRRWAARRETLGGRGS